MERAPASGRATAGAALRWWTNLQDLCELRNRAHQTLRLEDVEQVPNCSLWTLQCNGLLRNNLRNGPR